jgi:hypothetical protein
MLKQRPTLDIIRSNQYQVHAQVDKVKSHLIQSARDNIAELYDLHHFKSDAERLEFIDSLLADNQYIFPVSESVEGGVRSPNPPQRVSKAANEWRASTLLPPGSYPEVNLHQNYHWANNRGKYADGFYNSMIDNKDCHIPSPLIMFTCTALRDALEEWQKNKGVHPKASKSKLIAASPDHLNYFSSKKDGGKNASCYGAQVVHLAWRCRHLYILDGYLGHTTGELPTEYV